MIVFVWFVTKTKEMFYILYLFSLQVLCYIIILTFQMKFL